MAIEQIEKILSKKKVIITIIVVIIGFIVLNPITIIKPGEYGVVTNNITGEINENYLKNGWHFTIPVLQEITTYPVTERSYSINRDSARWLKGEDTSLLVPTSDNLHVNIDITLTYKLKSECLVDIYKDYYGKNIDYIESNMLDITLRDSIISNISKYSMLDIYSSKRAKIQDDIKEDLNEKYSATGFEFISVFISDVRLAPEGKALLEAETRQMIELINAKSQSEVNEILGKSLTDELIKLKILEKLSPNIQLAIIPYNADGEIDLEKFYNDIIGKSINADD